MNTKIFIPPIKSQGIKTKLVPWIRNLVPAHFAGTWIEPFMGTGAVAFNVPPHNAVLCDTNPHLIHFYQALSESKITSYVVSAYLIKEGQTLLEQGEKHYYYIRDRFNAEHSPLDFLFLNRSGFNGMIRFNKQGNFNIPFCRKPNRFSKAYITKISNQVDNIYKIIQTKKILFIHQSFEETIRQASANDIIYCDPPYIDRHTDYYNGWTETSEHNLFNRLSQFQGKFILSTWHHNDYRNNQYIDSLWSKYSILTRKHFYHVGGKEINRNSITEALITNLPYREENSKNIENCPVV
ncbi:MAG: Dam family site-specific DNA-(adenine-N6)-methyltransferase [Azoarcus sp.]|jgi:DNA adenine methylase|nr:Dam family site-specific DNA-(adenine-N6)-methyltransferase [Azoarcus sp.]